MRLFHLPDFSGNVGTEQKCLWFATSVKSAGCEPFQKVARSVSFPVCNFFEKSLHFVTLTFPAENVGNLENSGSGAGKVRSTFLADRCTPLKRKG